MKDYAAYFIDALKGYHSYLVKELFEPRWDNYFYVLIALSLTAWLLEIVIPWRKKQAFIRRDFWLDGFYIFFNYFIFSWIGYQAVSDVAVKAFNDLLAAWGANNLTAISIATWPVTLQWIVMFVIADFTQWNIHRLLHHVPWLWRFHQIHHSVKQMGFAAHLRFHCVETIVYKTLQYIPLAMIGFGIDDFFVVHIITIAIGHLNHANIQVNYGWLKYIFNNPSMHIWHHAKSLPYKYHKGVNFGISLSIWDYIFGYAYVPHSGKEITLGFEGDEHFPKNFWEQMKYPFK